MVSFIEWLFSEAQADESLSGRFAALYSYGPDLERIFGKGDPQPIAFATHIAVQKPPISKAHQEDLLQLMVLADATWRTDSLIENTPPKLSVVPNEPGVEIVAKKLKNVPCGYRGLDGEGCRKQSVPGAARCESHGGAITDPAVRGSLLLLAYAKMVGGSKKAVDTLIDVMDNSTNDLARVQASKELLDRAGLTADQHIQVHTESESREDVIDRVKAALDATRTRLLHNTDDDIVDAEIVGD